MEEKLINFETARIAKQRGFNAQCHSYYEVNKEAWLHHSVNSPVDYNGVEDTRHLFSAPTQSLLQKWLRDVHKINVHIYSIHGNDGSEFQLKWSADVYNLKQLNYENYRVMIGYELSNGVKDTFEEALEMGLNAALRIDMLWQ